jgi:tight adherence protein C
MNLIFFIALSLCIFCVVTLIGAPWFFRPSVEARRILDIVKSERPDKRKIGARELAREKLLDLARAFRARLGLTQDEKLRQRFVSAGMRGSNKLDVYFAARFLGPFLGIMAPGRNVSKEAFRMPSIFWSSAWKPASAWIRRCCGWGRKSLSATRT